MEKTDEKIEVGTVLYIVPTNYLACWYGKEVRRATVSKIGRQYIYVDAEGVSDQIKLNKKNLKNIDKRTGHRWTAFTSMEGIEKEDLYKKFRQLFSWAAKGTS